MTWKQLTERDCREWKLSAINAHDRNMWRSGVRSAMRAASQLSGRGPLVWMLPLYLLVNQKSNYNDMISHYKSMGANDPRGEASLDTRGLKKTFLFFSPL